MGNRHANEKGGVVIKKEENGEIPRNSVYPVLIDKNWAYFN